MNLLPARARRVNEAWWHADLWKDLLGRSCSGDAEVVRRACVGFVLWLRKPAKSTYHDNRGWLTLAERLKVICELLDFRFRQASRPGQFYRRAQNIV